MNYTYYVIDTLIVTVDFWTGKPELKQHWHASLLSLDEAHNEIDLLKKQPACIAYSLIEWTDTTPLSHFCHGSRYCGHATQTVLEHADRTYSSNGKQWLSLDDWQITEGLNKRVDGGAKLLPRELSERLARLMFFKNALRSEGMVRISWKENGLPVSSSCKLDELENHAGKMDFKIVEKIEFSKAEKAFLSLVAEAQKQHEVA
ncbi:hypothetical protein [Pseudoalteromonas rubra]|uniref:hypothetical protein n=1 Tax=Pseudoalteromonas rubra TaxID=43658 RepID=UPI002DBFFB15|nr:hypothetical protein [Pseudoalteromonas rubra]MEC4091616.1 hypothetical protein [Pseudoalteromonas rubra]